MEAPRSLTVRQQICYGVGHVLNDICAAMWFTYLLVFFHLVLQFDSSRAGALFLIGQIADALSTPFVGIFSDSNDNMWLCRYGKRKAWHLVGTLCVLASFPFIFNSCISCNNSSLNAQMFYYSAFIVIFQFGWASTQISHLSLIPELTPHEHQRTRLTSLRSSFTVISTYLVYLVTWMLLKFAEDANPSDQIGPQDAVKFERVVYFGLAFGVIAVIIFHIGVKENNVLTTIDTERAQHKTVTEFLKEPQFYQVALVYLCSRLFVNLSQVYIPLYLHETLVRNAESLAVVPLLMYFGSLVSTFVIHPMNRYLGRVVSFIIGALIGIYGCVWVRYGSGLYETETYIVGLLLGFGGTTMLVTTLGITADLIGPDTDTGAFVYGSMSFCDKLFNGIAVMVIQHWKCSSGCNTYYRDVLAYVCGGAAVVGVLPLFSLRNLSQRNVATTIEPTVADPTASDPSAAAMDEPLLH